VSELERKGYRFTLLSNGAVSVKQPDAYDPQAAEMMRYLALHKEETREHVREIQPLQKRTAGEVCALTGLTPDEAIDIGERIKRGEAYLIGKAVYHQSTGLFDVTFVPFKD